MKKCYLIHGFNVSDGGRNTTDKLIPFVEAVGFIPVEIDYGNFDLIEVREENSDVVDRLLSMVSPGDVFIAHSNGNAIVAEAIERGCPFSRGVMIHPALRSFWTPPKNHPITRITVFHHWTDYATWGGFLLRMFSPGNLIYGWHSWGAMGSTGALGDDSRMINKQGAWGHSQGFKNINKYGSKYAGALL